MIRRPSLTLPNQFPLRHSSSRDLLMKLSAETFWIGLPGLIGRSSQLAAVGTWPCFRISKTLFEQAQACGIATKGLILEWISYSSCGSDADCDADRAHPLLVAGRPAPEGGLPGPRRRLLWPWGRRPTARAISNTSSHGWLALRSRGLGRRLIGSFGCSA